MNNKNKEFPKHRWYDWVFLATVGLFIGAVTFVVLDSIFLHKFTRIIAALLGAGCIGVVATSIAEDVNIEFRYSREFKEDKDKYDDKYKS
jgi:hypothetical protein